MRKPDDLDAIAYGLNSPYPATAHMHFDNADDMEPAEQWLLLAFLWSLDVYTLHLSFVRMYAGMGDYTSASQVLISLTALNDGLMNMLQLPMLHEYHDSGDADLKTWISYNAEGAAAWTKDSLVESMRERGWGGYWIDGQWGNLT